MNAIEAQDVGSERAQTRKDARIAADAAGVPVVLEKLKSHSLALSR